MIGGIIWRADPGSIEIKFHADDLSDVVLRWASLTGYEYACTYNRRATTSNCMTGIARDRCCIPSRTRCR
jgi:hypothetical protein